VTHALYYCRRDVALYVCVVRLWTFTGRRGYSVLILLYPLRLLAIVFGSGSILYCNNNNNMTWPLTTMTKYVDRVRMVIATLYYTLVHCWHIYDNILPYILLLLLSLSLLLIVIIIIIRMYARNRKHLAINNNIHLADHDVCKK